MRVPSFVPKSREKNKLLERMSHAERELYFKDLMEKAWKSVGKKPRFGIRFYYKVDPLAESNTMPLPDDPKQQKEMLAKGGYVVITNMRGGLIYDDQEDGSSASMAAQQPSILE